MIVTVAVNRSLANLLDKAKRNDDVPASQSVTAGSLDWLLDIFRLRSFNQWPRYFVRFLPAL